jgi:hypothetical protein
VRAGPPPRCPSSPRASLLVALLLVCPALAACPAPPGSRPAAREAVTSVEVAPVEAAPVEAAPVEAAPVEVEPLPTVIDEPAASDDPELAAARRSIVDGRVSADALATLAASSRPAHRRATRLLAVIDHEAPGPIAVIEPPPRPSPEPLAIAPAPAPVEPAPAPALPAPVAVAPEVAPLEPEPSHDDDDHRIDPIDPRAFAADAAIVAWIRDDPPQVDASTSSEPPRDPFAGLMAIDEPAVLLPIDWQAATPRLILTRLELVAVGDRVRLDVVGSATVALRMQPLAAHVLRVRLEGAGAVPNFLAARPSDERVAVSAIRRGRGAVEIDVELAADVALLSVTPLANGAALEFGRVAAHNPDP